VGACGEKGGVNDHPVGRNPQPPLATAKWALWRHAPSCRQVGTSICAPSRKSRCPPTAWRRPSPPWSGEQALTSIYREQENGERVCIAEGFEWQGVLTAEVDGQTITWSERQLVVRLLKQAQAMEAALRARLEKAQHALAALNERGRGKKRFADEATLRQAAEAIVAR
jgi:hypothetical protein